MQTERKIITKFSQLSIFSAINNLANISMDPEFVLVVSCGDGNAVEILVLQAPGKRAMPAQDFLRGNPIEKGAFFE